MVSRVHRHNRPPKRIFGCNPKSTVTNYLSPFVEIGELVLGSLHDVLIQGPRDTVPSKDISSSLRIAIGKVLR